MIISDLTYQETAVEANELEGGLDLLTGTFFLGQTLVALVGSQSTAQGSSTMAGLQANKTMTGGFLDLSLPFSV